MLLILQDKCHIKKIKNINIFFFKTEGQLNVFFFFKI